MQGKFSNTGGSAEPLIRFQASESIAVTILLTLAGGLQDSYSYFARGHVFANAQTGNIVLLSSSVLQGNLHSALSYLIPVLSFAAGIYASLEIKRLYRKSGRLHWRHIVAYIEVLLLISVGLIPENHSQIANALTSFSCAMQVEAFRTVRGNAYASTMCIGNLRAFVEHMHSWKEKKESIAKATDYLIVLASFAAGAGLGAYILPFFGLKSIWCSALLIILSAILMLRRPE